MPRPMTRSSQATVRALAELLEYLGRAIQQSCFAAGLKPAQWSVLRYLSRANPSARTVSGVAAAMLTTRSTTSQTVAALRRKGLVAARHSPVDARIVHLALTAKGERLLASDPLDPLIRTLQELSPEDIDAAARTVELLIRRAIWRADGAMRAGNLPAP